jgi:hypothetical protein
LETLRQLLALQWKCLRPVENVCAHSWHLKENVRALLRNVCGLKMELKKKKKFRNQKPEKTIERLQLPEE